MYREGGVERGKGVRLVSCSLSELSNCSCLVECREEVESSSRRRKTGAKLISLEPADMLAELSAKNILLNRQPTLIDRLILQNKSALMAPKGRKKPEPKEKGPSNRGTKRKNDSNNAQPPSKRSKKEDNKNKRKTTDNSKPKETKKSEVRVTRKTNNKKVPLLLRSGRTMVDILKQKRNGLKNFPRKRNNRDSNSNVFNETNDKKEVQKEEKTPENKRKRKKRKRCSMWHTKKLRKPKREEKGDEDIEASLDSEMPKLEPVEAEPKENNLILDKPDITEDVANNVNPEVKDLKEPHVQLIQEQTEINEDDKEPIEIKRDENIQIIESKELVKEVEPIENNLEVEPEKSVADVLSTKEEMPDADSTSDVCPLNDSVSELSLFLPEDEIELLQPDQVPSEVLPDSTKTSEKDENKDKSEDVKSEPNDLKSEENDEVNDIDEKLLAEVQSQLEQQESLRESLKFAPIAQDDNDDNSTPEVQKSEEPKEDEVEKVVEMTSEQKQMKESVLQALGLKSLESDEKPQKRSEGYTGTLKAIIKLNRFGDKKQMIYKRAETDISSKNKLKYKICSEAVSQEDQEVRNINQNKNGSNLLYPSLPSSPTEDSDGKEEKISEKESLVIPEKSSSFSIHPGRLCLDVCSYCFGKFGSLDTPCHVAQLKGEERQKKILQNEPHLTGESCLCDACYRFVDRKANCPSKALQGNVSSVKSRLSALSECCVSGCKEQATRTMKRKWLIKLKKCINHKLEIDADKPGHGIYYSLCTQHHNWVEYLTVCGICRRRLNRNNLFSLGLETDRLNLMLAEDGIPARLSDNLFLCKLCRYYSDLRLKYTDTEAIPPDKKAFYRDYRRKILLSLDIALSESDDDSLDVQRGMRAQECKNGDDQGENDNKDKDEVMSLHGLATLLGDQPQQQARIQVKFGNVNIGTLSNLNIGQQGNSSSSKPSPQSDRPHSPALSAQLDYQGCSAPDGYWEKYTSTIMFDKNTKQLWTELQRPYGSQSSFLRHLVMLEKVWRAGFLVLKPDADERAVKYITSAKNRIHAFEGVPAANQEQENGEEAKEVVRSPPPPPPQQPPAPQQPPQPPPPLPQPAKPPVQPSPTPLKQPYPNFPTSGEIEVTEVKKDQKPAPKNPPQNRNHRVSIHQRQQNPQMTQQQQLMHQHHQMQQQLSHPHLMPDTLREFYMRQQGHSKKKITPLDRAKSLVRMAPPMGHHQYFQMQQQRFQQQQAMGMKYNPGVPSQPPPLLKLGYQNRPILPKLPKALTVVSMPAASSQPPPSQPAITLRHSGITIEKQVAPARHHLPIEKPSISVFREPSSHP